MGWLQKRQMTEASSTLYASNLTNNVLLVGLGNIGKKYALTRHNIGMECLEYFINSRDEMSELKDKKDFFCNISEGIIDGNKIIAITPTTFMNLSSKAVLAVSQFYKIPPNKIFVLHDDLDIKYGQIRTRLGGASAGHKGIESISNAIGEDYGRIRIGIGPKAPAQIKSEDFVLAKFSPKQQESFKDLYKETSSILSELCYSSEIYADTRSFLF